MNDLRKNLISINAILLPRILTQVCRDKFSPLYGSFDRNWWHYKIRDFSSLILQQGGYSLYCYYKNSDEFKNNNVILNLIKASAYFWNKQAKKDRKSGNRDPVAEPTEKRQNIESQTSYG